MIISPLPKQIIMHIFVFLYDEYFAKASCLKKRERVSKNPKHDNKKEGKDQESMQSGTTPNPGHHMGK